MINKEEKTYNLSIKTHIHTCIVFINTFLLSVNLKQQQRN